MSWPILRWDSGCLSNRLHSMCKVDWPILRWDMTSNLAVVYTIRIRGPSPKWIGISTVGFWMLRQHRPQKVQNSFKCHHVGSASLFSSSLSSRRCICLFHIVVSEYIPKITYFSSRRCICLFHIVKSEYMPKITYFSSCEMHPKYTLDSQPRDHALHSDWLGQRFHAPLPGNP